MRRRWLWIGVDLALAAGVILLVGSAVWQASSDVRAAALRFLSQPSERPPTPKRADLDRAYDLYRARKWRESLVYFDAALGLDCREAAVGIQIFSTHHSSL